MIRSALGNLLIAFGLAFGVSVNAYAQSPNIQWQKCIGGSSEEWIYCSTQTNDGGYAFAGATESLDGDVSGNHGESDIWVVKLDAIGDTEWEKCFGGNSEDVAYSIIQTSDGGYAIAGITQSSDGEVSGNHGGEDAWVLKLSSAGAVQWKKCLGGTDVDLSLSIIQTTDKGFIVAGQTFSNNGDISGNQGAADAWIAKLDNSGSILWEKNFGGSEDDGVSSVIQTLDGGFAIGGWTASNNGDASGNHGGTTDAWLVKFSSNRTIQWQKCLGGTGNDWANSIIQTADGGYAIAGYTSSNDSQVTGNHGGFSDAWVVKLSGMGDIQWEKCLGGSGRDIASSLVQTSDGGFAIAGYTNSIDGNVSGNHGNDDAWVVKLNSIGGIQWQKCLGGSSDDEASSIIQTADKGLLVSGYTNSNDGDVSGNHGLTDAWVVKLSPPPPPPVVSYITPDAGAPGMCVAVEIVGPDSLTLNLGNDAAYLPGTVVTYVHPSDSALVKLGPSASGWGGRFLQTMIMIEPNIPQLDTSVMLQVSIFGGISAPFRFRILSPRHLGTITNGGVIGQSPNVLRTAANTIVVDSMILQNGTYTIAQTDPDAARNGNQAYLPVRILSAGPIRLVNATLSVNGQNASTGSSGGAGGPGGGGGGSGYPGSGGDGFTGGGGMGENSSPGSTHGGAGTGSATGSPYYQGGLSLNGIPGGSGMEHSGLSFDEGAGGGTGFPFGISGAAGVYNASSPYGGYGAGSGGGSVTTSTNYGGGGAGYATDGTPGQGNGDNRGHAHGDVALAPFAGGSGGGSGNVTHFATGQGGSGGGGGGAIELTSFSNFDFQSGAITANGGKGSNGVSGFLEPGAGGGGGSGGAVSIGARDSIDISSASTIVENGGSGGSGSNSGGSGGLGRARLDGYVSKVHGNASSAGFYSTNKDYTGPSIQRAVFTRDSVTVIGYSSEWDGIPNRNALASIVLRWLWPSSGSWLFAGAVPVLDPSSHTSKWSVTIPRSNNPADSEVYLAAVLQESVIGGSWPMMNLMSHTSGLIAKPPAVPRILVKDKTIDFGDVTVGKCKDTTFKIYSVGRADLLLGVPSFTISGPGASEYSVTSPTPLDIRPGDSVAVTISFCPTAKACPIPATLTVNNNDTVQTIQLTGCGIQPQAVVHPLVIDFGRVHIGDCKDTTIMLLDTGTDDLTLTSENLVDGRYFTLLDQGPIHIAAKDSVRLGIRFCPKDTSIVSTIDSIISDAPQSPILVTLIGGGKIGILSLPDTLDFGLVHKGACKDSGFYAVNSGNDSLLVTDHILSKYFGSVNGFTEVSPAFPFVINAKDSVFVTIQYCAVDTGSIGVGLVLVTDSPSTRTIVLLAHTGVGILSIPDTIDFGSVLTGGCRDSLVAVSNIGTDTLVLDTNNVFKPPFSYNGTNPFRLAPGEKTTIDLRFCPTDTNVASENVQFDTIGPGISPLFTLLGKGIQGALSTSGPIDFGCVPVGTSVTYKLSIKNTGGATLTNISAVVAPSNAATIVHNPPATLPAYASDSIVLLLGGGVVGKVNATITINWSDGGSATLPITLPITAQISPAPKITTLDSSVVFDTTNIGDTSISKCVTITNYSCIALPIDSIMIVSGLAGEFIIVSNSAGKTISDSATATICVRYKPLRGGEASGKLLVISGKDTVEVSVLTGNAAGTALGVRLAIDTIAGRPGDIVNMPVRTLNDVTSASISSLTFRVTFDPMQLDMKAPVSPSVANQSGNVPSFVQSTQSATPSATYTVKKYSIGDQEITATYSSPLTGTPIVAELPFEILLPDANTASVHLQSASFGASLATLATANDGLIQIEQCDTNERIVLLATPIDIAPINPNPFSGHSSVSFDLHTAGHVQMQIFNTLGSLIMTALDEDLSPASFVIDIDASKLPSGSYKYVTTWTGPGPSLRDEKTMVVMR